MLYSFFSNLERVFIFTLIVSFSSLVGYGQTLIINEVSQGETGGMEYVEFVVVDSAVSYNCGSSEPPCIDIRGWIIDDNSGYHGPSGVASGACRFSFDPLWSCVPLGTVIVIYNDADPNNQMPSDDISLSDGNCSIVAPISSSLFETNSTTPGASACDYPSSGWTAGGVWTNIVMANGGDCFRIVNLSGCEVFSVCWDDNDQNTMIYFQGGATSTNSATNTVYYFNDGDPTNSANWTIGCADEPNCGQQDQTPGAPNNSLNADYISQFNNGCTPITPIDVVSNIDQNATCSCDGQASATPSGSIPGYTYEWFDDSFNSIGQTDSIATGLCGGTYYVIATSSIDCSDTAEVTLSSSGSGILGISTPPDDTVDCLSNMSASYSQVSEFLNDGGSIDGSISDVDTTSFNMISEVSDNNSCPEIISRTYEITDSCGGIFTSTQNIIIQDTINPTGTAPADVTVGCDSDVPLADPTAITDEADNCTVQTVTHIDDVSNNNICNGEVITRTYSITDACGNSIEVQQIITIDAYTPTFTLAGSDPTLCGNSDGYITISGLDSNTDYTLEYDGNAPTMITTDAVGEYVITGLGAGSYTSFTISDVDCPACSTTDSQIVTLTDPNPPAVDAGIDQQVCEGTAVTLTADNPDGASISWDNGITDGTAFSPADGSITYTVTAELDGCSNTDQVTVEVYAVPAINPLSNQEACDSYTLPAIIGTDLTGDEAYYTGAGGTGTQLSAGDVISTEGTTTLYIYDETTTTPNCFDEQTFEVTINLTPVIDPLFDQVVCDSFILPEITGANLTDNEAYYTGAGGTGTQLNGGDVFTTVGTTTLYIYNETTAPNCFDEQNFEVTINLTPVIDGVADQQACDLYTLPTITGVNLTGNEAYYDAPSSGGTQYNAGDAITTEGTTTLYIYDETATTPNCFDEVSFDVTISHTPAIDPLVDQEVCDSFTLPEINGINLTGNEAYYDTPNGEGIQYNDGEVITTTGTTIFYIYDETATTPSCFDEQTFEVTINNTPTFTLSSTNPSDCGVADGTITISGLEPNTTYDITYTEGGGTITTNTMNSDVSGDIIINGLAAGSYFDFIVSFNGCTTTDNSSINLVDPNAPDIGAGEDFEVCEGEDVVLTAENPDGANISWDNGVTDGTPFTLDVGTFTFTVTAELFGCISTDQVVVSVNPSPNVNAGDDLEICEGDQVILTASGADSYTWDNDVIDGEPFTPSETNTYTVTGSTSGCENTDELTVTIVDNPTVYFEADTIQGCVPLSVNFSNLTTGDIANCTYTFSDGTVLNGCDIKHTFNEAGCYDVTLEVENSTGCSSTTKIENYICVESYPIAAFSFDTEELSNIFNRASFMNGSIGGSTYDWSFGDGETSSEMNPTHTYDTESGEEEYEIILVTINDFGCTDTVSKTIPIIEELIFYVPNTFTPDDDIHNPTFKPVFTSGFDPMDYTLLIFNRWGEVIFESQDAEIGWDGTYGIESNQIVKDGTYVWKIEFKTTYTDERKLEVGHVNILR